MRRLLVIVLMCVMAVSYVGCANKELRKIENDLYYIQELGEMQEEGLISLEEFEQKKKEILDL